VTDGSLDPLLVDPTRLSVVSVLSSARWAEFAFVRDTVGLTDSALSKQVAKLEDRGHVEVKRGYVGKRPRTWLNLTDTGRTALQRHARALQDIVAASRTAGEGHDPSPAPG